MALADAFAAQAQAGSGAGAGRDRHAHRAVDGRDLQRGAEDRFLQGDRHVGDDVVAVAVEAGVGGDGDLDQCIAGGGAVEAGAALAAQAQDVAVLGARRDADVEGLAVGQRQAAGGAGGGVDEADGQ